MKLINHFSAIPKSIWILGFVSLLMDLSSEMIHALLPIYITGVLGASALSLGLIEGIAEAIALITKVFSGVISDYFGKRKALAAFGYGLSALSKPLFPLSNSIVGVLVARFSDRVGKGIRGAPRDALVGQLAPAALRGACFGLRQSLDTVGAFLGPLIAVLLMYLYANDIHLVFWVACLPAIAAAALIFFAVSEPVENNKTTDSKKKLRLSAIKQLSRPYWIVCGLAFIMTLARFSEAFLILKADSLGFTLTLIPLVLILMNVVYALSSYPAGIISDKFGRKSMLLIGLLLLCLADVILAFSNGTAAFIVGISIWGLHMGLTQGVISALVADYAETNLLGTAFGILNLSMGLAVLLASVIAGLAWDSYGPASTFLLGAGFAAMALFGFLLLEVQVSKQS